MDLTKEAIEKIVELGHGDELDIDGHKYTTKPVFPVKMQLPEPVTVQTLTGLCDLIGHHLNGIHEEVGSEIVVVRGYGHVVVGNTLCDEWGQRELHIEAKARLGEQPFPFSKFLEQEAFIIWVQSCFVQTSECQELLKLVSNLTGETITTSQDDGISQKTAVKTGVTLKEGVVVRPRWTLAPYRTFPEIDQPASEFVFRLRPAGEGQIPVCALFEADGGHWKMTTVLAIKAYLEERVHGLPVIA
jgi:hypothetical protein